MVDRPTGGHPSVVAFRASLSRTLSFLFHQEGSIRRTHPHPTHPRFLLSGDECGVGPVGLGGGWEMSQSPYARGCNDVSSIKLGQNVLMYSVTH